jgi:glycosyltransferase involved in cell wall biosynthesis
MYLIFFLNVCMGGSKMKENIQLRVCVVGSGSRFWSGISFYTRRIANALASSYKVSVIQMRQLLPTRLYPGRLRVDANMSWLEYCKSVNVFDGVDWYWLPSIFRALFFLIREHPEIVIFQWWTGTVLHSYIVLALAARLLGCRIVIEFHEILDTGEEKLRPVQIYVNSVAPLLMRLASGFVVHSDYDRPIVEKRYGLKGLPVARIPHGPYDHYQAYDKGKCYRSAPEESFNLLWLGVIRPYKGVEDLILAFDSIPQEQISGYWLTIVGETWAGWTLPAELIEKSRYRDRITFVNHYANDEEVAAFFNGADGVVLPYHRSSASGPLHTAMSWGLPVIVTEVGGLPEAVVDYKGALLIPPQNPTALQCAIRQIATLRGQRFADPHSWERTVNLYSHLFSTPSDNHLEN